MLNICETIEKSQKTCNVPNLVIYIFVTYAYIKNSHHKRCEVHDRLYEIKNLYNNITSTNF